MERRLPSLDGARATAILLVIAAHLTEEHPLPVLWRVDYGNLGVRVFFVISGFIITTLLLRERELTGGIDLKDFYFRRLFRIVPAYYAFVAIIVLLIPTGRVPAQYSELPAVLLYYSNYQIAHGSLGHSWSLSVEEQFYLLWPTTLLLLGLRKSVLACGLLLITAPAFRALSELHLWPTYPKFAFESACDALAAGCLLATLRSQLWAIAAYRRVVSSPFVAALPLAALLLMALEPGVIFRDLVGYPILNLGIAMMLDRYTRFPLSPVGRLLNLRPVVWIGALSYSLYLWQQLFTFRWGQQLLAFDAYPVTARLACTFACAAASFYLIEQPFLQLRARIAARQRQLPVGDLPAAR